MIDLETAVAKSNGCNKQEANEMIDDELNVCRDMFQNGDLNYSDMEDACFDLGIDLDHIEQLLLRLC